MFIHFVCGFVRAHLATFPLSDLGMTMAAVLDDGLRRLSMMELALEVNFQVILPGLGARPQWLSWETCRSGFLFPG
jgi:hypothetical protein